MTHGTATHVLGSLRRAKLIQGDHQPTGPWVEACRGYSPQHVKAALRKLLDLKPSGSISPTQFRAFLTSRQDWLMGVTEENARESFLAARGKGTPALPLPKGGKSGHGKPRQDLGALARSVLDQIARNRKTPHPALGDLCRSCYQPPSLGHLPSCPTIAVAKLCGERRKVQA